MPQRPLCINIWLYLWLLLEIGFLEVRWLGKTLYVSPNISLREGVGLTGCLVPGVITTEGEGEEGEKKCRRGGGKTGKKRLGLRLTGPRLIYLCEPLHACVLYNGAGMEKLGTKRFALRTNIFMWPHLLTCKAHGQGSPSPRFYESMYMTQPVLTPWGWENHLTSLSLRGGGLDFTEHFTPVLQS